jgi:L-ornithine N5-monooxygenase
VNEIFNPSHTDHIFSLDPDIRSASIAADRNTNYGVVRPELIDRLYESLYMQRIRYPNETDWRHRLLPYRTVTSIEDSPTVPGGVRLRIRNESGKFYLGCGGSEEEIMDVNVVFVATGYRRDAHEEMLKDARSLMPKESRESGKWQVRRNYGVVFEEGSVSEDAGIWLQGCNEKTHGVS